MTGAGGPTCLSLVTETDRQHGTIQGTLKLKRMGFCFLVQSFGKIASAFIISVSSSVKRGAGGFSVNIKRESPPTLSSVGLCQILAHAEGSHLSLVQPTPNS